MHSHSHDEGSLFSEIEVSMVMEKANDVCRKTTRWILCGGMRKCNASEGDSEGDEPTEEQL